MNVLLVYPKYPETFWSFKYALKFVSKKAAFPPLGLLTVAALLPISWNKRLLDLNVSKWKDKDLDGIDMVMISAMLIQEASVEEIIQRCQARGVKIVVGGPLFTISGEEQLDDRIDHYILDEGEVTIPQFLADLEKGTPRRVYTSPERPDLSRTPRPRWELISFKNYATLPVQYSRGCPFNCDFCDIAILNGRVPRTKGSEQMLAEMEILYERGWRGGVFIVDDNFIGHKKQVKHLLNALREWNQVRRHPFHFITEASLNLADDDELLKLMAEANFSQVFLGIETPNEGSLTECNKVQNAERDLEASILKIQRAGLEVLGGFIVGFDNDPPSIFEQQIRFIQRIGVVTAMVGLLHAVPRTPLYLRLKEQGRILMGSTGNNTDGTLNFIPKMDNQVLIDGYRQIIDTIYNPRQYYERIKTFLKGYQPNLKGQRLSVRDIRAFAKSLVILGIFAKERSYYWRLLTVTLIKYRRSFPQAISCAIYGYHFRRVLKKVKLTPPGPTPREAS
ncbi:MAG: DUF4070 domain-containing protein [Deltaproteobacteria bacterium]|nr:DUF4070 domain-containing protein [Deltaproteobacteria bacterium]